MKASIASMIFMALFGASIQAQELETSGVHRHSALFSTLLFVNDGSLTSCRVVNASRSDISVEVQIFFVSDNLPPEDFTEFSTCGPEKLPAGSACSALYENNSGGGEGLYCRIMVAGNKNAVRGAFGIRSACDVACEDSVVVEVR